MGAWMVSTVVVDGRMAPGAKGDGWEAGGGGWCGLVGI